MLRKRSQLKEIILNDNTRFLANNKGEKYQAMGHEMVLYNTQKWAFGKMRPATCNLSQNEKCDLFWENGRIFILRLICDLFLGKWSHFSFCDWSQNGKMQPFFVANSWSMKCDHFPGKSLHFIFCDRSQVAGRILPKAPKRAILSIWCQKTFRKTGTYAHMGWIKRY